MAKGPGPYSGASPGLKKKTREPSLAERREHEGRTPQPGVPAGSRNTEYPSASGYEYPSGNPLEVDLEKTGNKKLRKARRIRRKRDELRSEIRETLEDADLPGVEDTPQYHVVRARTRGKFPPEKLLKKNPRAFAKAFKAAEDYHDKFEGLEEDPLAELAISTAVTAGVGGAAQLGGKALGGTAGKVLATGGSKLAGGGASAASEVVEDAGKAIAARSASSAGKAARGGAKRIGRRIKKPSRAAAGKRISKAGRRARRHPVRSSAAAHAGGVPLGVDTELGQRVSDLAAGTAEAAYENPLGTAAATGRGLAGAVVGPLQLGAAGVKSLAEGNSAPLEETATEQFEGTMALANDLLSGDRQRVRETIENDVGLSPYVGAAAIPATKAWRKGRRKVRQGAAKTRSRFGGRRTAPPEVETHVFAPLERRAARQRVAKDVARANAGTRLDAAAYQKQILKALKKAPKPRSLRNVRGMEAGDLLQTFAEYGIRDMHDVRTVRARGPVGRGKESGTGQVTLKAALDFAEAHPEILTDKHFKEALDAYIASTETLPAAKVRKGRRATVMAQGDMFKVTRPEDRVPEGARPYTDATTRAAAWKEANSRRKDIARLKREARSLPKARAESKYSEARRLDELNRNLIRELRPYSRPGQALRPSARRKFYDAPLLREYEADVAKARESSGLAEPAWTAHRQFKELGDVAPTYPTAAGRVQHMRSGSLAAEDMVDRSLRSLVANSVVGPRLRAGGQEMARRFTEQEMLPVVVEGKTKNLITRAEWNDAVRSGQYSPDQFVLFPARQFKQAVLDPFKSPDELISIAGEGLSKDLRRDTPGDKYVVVRREAAKEFSKQISPTHYSYEKVINFASQGASRWLLLNPAWVMIQAVAEAVPMVMAHPELLNPAKMAKLTRALYRNQKLRPEEARAFAATAGEAPTSLYTPSQMAPQLSVNSHTVFSDGARALTRSKMGQWMFSMVRLRTLGVFDNWRQGKYRQVLLAAEADKQLNGWMSNFRQVLGMQKKISDDLRKLPLDQQIAVLTTPRYRKQLDKMQVKVEAVAGNWQAFTRFERDFAPFLVFYPFIRYSLRWPLTFAKHHPIAGTVAQFLAQANAEEIDKILGGPPKNPLNYALPVVWNGEGDAEILMEGRRAAPGTSAPTQALLSNQPNQLLGMINPLFNAGLTGLTGVNAYTGKQEPNRGQQAVDLLLQTSPALRFADIDTTDLGGLLGLDVDEAPSAAGQVFDSKDENRRRRSFLTPWETISGEDFKAMEQFGEDLDTKYSDPVPSIWDNPAISRALFGEGGKGGWVRGEKGPLRELLKQHRKSQRASDRAKKLEEPFFEESGDLTPAQKERLSEGLKLLQDGYIMVKPKESASAKLDRELGIQAGASQKDLDRALGIPTSPDKEALDRKLGISLQLGAASKGKAGSKGRRKGKRVTLPKIEPLTSGGGSTEFAQWFSHYSGLDPQVVGAWVLSEGAGESGSTGGEAGKENWLAADYPAEKTLTSQAPFFNDTPQKAAKATVDWMLGKLPEPYTSGSSGIRRVLETAPGKSPEEQAAILASSGWVDGNEGTLNQGYYESILANMGAVNVTGNTAATVTQGSKPKKQKGPYAGSRKMVRKILGAKVHGDKEEGHSPTGDHDPSQPESYAQDIGSVYTSGNPAEGEPPYSQETLDKAVRNIRKMGGDIPDLVLGQDDWEGVAQGYRIQLLTVPHGSGPHIHLGVRWTGEEAPAGTYFGAPSGGESSGGYAAPDFGSSTVLASSTGVPSSGATKMRKGRRKKKRSYQDTVKRLEAVGIPMSDDAPEEIATPILDELRKGRRTAA